MCYSHSQLKVNGKAHSFYYSNENLIKGAVVSNSTIGEG